MPAAEKDRRKDERKGAGFLVRFLDKLGIRPAGAPGPVGAPGAAGRVSIGLPDVPLGNAGFGAALATKAGTTAFLVACVTVGTVMVAGIAALVGGPANHESPESLFSGSRPPERIRPAQDAAASSLDILSQAARNDASLRAPAQPLPAEGFSGSAVGAGSSAGAREAAGSAASSGAAAAAKLAKLGGTGSASSLGGVGGVSGGPGLDARTAADKAAAKVFGLTPMGRDKKGAEAGRRAANTGRGRRTSDALLLADKDGFNQRGARNPSMSKAGLTFDGATQGIQGSGGGPITFGGIPEQGPKTRLSPNNVIDQKEVPGPAPVSDEKNSTPYQWMMYAAVGALLGAMVLQKMAGQKKDAAKALVGPEKAAALAAAASLHWLAAAAAGLAAVMGGMMMKGYDQAMQGMIFVGSGGLLAAFNIKAALDMSKASKEAEESKDKAVEDIKAKDAEINKQLGADGAQDSGNAAGAGMQGLGNMGNQPSKPADADKKPEKKPQPVKKQAPPSTGGGTGTSPDFNF